MKLAGRIAYRIVMFALTIAFVTALWEFYQIVGPQDGGKFLGVRILPRANDNAMPHVSTMLSRYSRPEVRGSDKKFGSSCSRALGFHYDCLSSDSSSERQLGLVWRC